MKSLQEPLETSKKLQYPQKIIILQPSLMSFIKVSLTFVGPSFFVEKERKRSGELYSLALKLLQQQQAMHLWVLHTKSSSLALLG